MRKYIKNKGFNKGISELNKTLKENNVCFVKVNITVRFLMDLSPQVKHNSCFYLFSYTFFNHIHYLSTFFKHNFIKRLFI